MLDKHVEDVIITLDILTVFVLGYLIFLWIIGHSLWIIGLFLWIIGHFCGLLDIYQGDFSMLLRHQTTPAATATTLITPRSMASPETGQVGMRSYYYDCYYIVK